MFHSDCPSTSSSSKDSGSEERIEITRDTVNILEIPEHPSWKSHFEQRPRKVQRSHDETLDTTAEIWLNPFKHRLHKPRLKLPLLEKNSEGKYAQSTKKKSVRFSSPLTAGAEDENHSTLDLIAPPAKDDICDDSSSFYGSPARYASDSNAYLSGSGQACQSNPYLEFYKAPLAEHSFAGQLDKPDQSAEEDSDCEQKISEPPLRMVNGSAYDTLSAASCDTPLADIIVDIKDEKDRDRPNLIDSIIESFKMLEDLCSSLGEQNSYAPIQCSSTLVEAFVRLEVLAKALKTEFERSKQSSEEMINFHEKKMKTLEEAISQLQSELQSKQLSEEEIKRLEAEVRCRSSEIKILQKDNEDARHSARSTAAELYKTNAKLSSVTAKSSSLEKVIDSHINKMVNKAKGLNLRSGEKIETKLAKIGREVDDYVESTETQIADLEEQKNKCLDSLKATQADILNFQLMVDSLQDENSKVTDKNKQLLSSLESSDAKSRNLAEKVSGLQADLIQEKQKANDLCKKLEANEKYTEELKTSVNNSEVELKMSQKRYQLLELQIKRSADRVAELEVHISENAVLKKEYDVKMEHARTLEQNIRSLGMELENSKNEVMVLKKDSAILKDSIKIKQETIDLLQSKIAFTEDKLEKVESDLALKTKDTEAALSKALDLESAFRAKENQMKRVDFKSKEMREMMIYSVKDLLQIIANNLNKVVTDECIEEILQSFDKVATTYNTETMAPFFSCTNKIVGGSLDFVVTKLQHYHEDLRNERDKCAEINASNEELASEMQNLRRNFDMIMVRKRKQERRHGDSERRSVSDRRGSNKTVKFSDATNVTVSHDNCTEKH